MTDEERERRHGRGIADKLADALINLCGAPANTLAKWGSFAFIAYFSSNAIVALAGNNTWADINVNLGAIFTGQNEGNDCSIFILLALLFLLLSMGLAHFVRRERKLRHDDRERLCERVRRLEGLIDKGRSTSSLTPRGENHPDDLSP